MQQALQKVQEENQTKTPQQRLRERCRDGKKKGPTMNAAAIQQLSALGQMPRSRKLKKIAEKNLSPDQHLLLQKMWAKDDKKNTDES